VLQEFKAGKVYRSPSVSSVRWLCLADVPIPDGRLTFYINLVGGEWPLSLGRPRIINWRRDNAERRLGRTVWEEEE
jgi:hypothetical protein